ncbi:MAG: endonuclease V [Candidatus Nitrosotenuis sp.]
MHTPYLKLQEKLASKVVTKDSFESIKTICAVDVSYKNKAAFASAVLVDKKTFQVVEYVNLTNIITSSYVPGLLYLREAPPALAALRSLKNNYELLMVDGHGQLHPRKCGLACYLGLALDKPTIGVAKNLLCGKIKNEFVLVDGEILGAVVRTKKAVFVSVGHKISLKTAVNIVAEMIKPGQWLPEPLRLADLYSKTQRK